MQHRFFETDVPEAYVSGVPVVAACGHVWVPAEDETRPTKTRAQLPWCPTCLEETNAVDDDIRTIVVAPYRPGPADRAKLWDFAQGWWRNDHPNWDIFTGTGPLTGPFCRSAAINDAVAKAGDDWDVAIIIDTDVLVDPHAARAASEVAHSTDGMVLVGNERVMLTKEGTDRILSGYNGNWRVKGIQERVYTDHCSCAVAVSRKLWEQVNGFDEWFRGWGWEDIAFRIACETMSGKPMVTITSAIFHLWHTTSHENNPRTKTYQMNKERCERYRANHWDVKAIQALLDEAVEGIVEREPELPSTRIPRIMHRTIPAEVPDVVEHWWIHAQQLHPGWDFRTYREPLDPTEWPMTGDLWDRCQNGAQKAGLIRLEALVRWGGVYLDSDVEPVRSLEPLLHLPAFGAWEDPQCLPDAILGCEPGHPAFVKALEDARAVIQAGGDAWHSGPGVTTEVLPNRDDVLCLPPGAFYPQHYLDKKARHTVDGPWVFLIHHYHGSWLTPQQKAEHERRLIAEEGLSPQQVRDRRVQRRRR